MTRTPSHVPLKTESLKTEHCRADKARLDWLDTFAESIDRYQGPPVRWRVWCDEPGMVDEPHCGPTLRAAIDATMSRMEAIDTL